MNIAQERRRHDRRRAPGLEQVSQAPEDSTVEIKTETAMVEEIFLKNAGTGLYRKGLSRRRKALREVKGFVTNCRDKDTEVTVTSINRKKDPE